MARGTQAELDSLKSQLQAKRNEYNKAKSDYDDLKIACDSMVELNLDYLRYDQDLRLCIEAYNQDGNKWVGYLFDEVAKTEEYFDSAYQKFNAVNANLHTLYGYYEADVERLSGEVASLQRKVDNFVVEEDEDDKGGFWPWQ